MNVLLLRPVPGNDRFGLGPFFRIEPLGMEYVAAALEARGHRATVVDLRYSRSVDHCLRKTRPGLVGIACMHALETDDALALAADVRRASPGTFIVLGGHAAAAYAAPFFTSSIDAVCVDDGEVVVPALADALERRQPCAGVAGLLLRGGDGCFERTPPLQRTFALDDVPLPLRRDVDRWRRHYACLLFRPVWLIETALGRNTTCIICSGSRVSGRSGSSSCTVRRGAARS
jgi:hopanoid C-3 methylase